MNEHDDRFFEVLLRHAEWKNRHECDRCGDTRGWGEDPCECGEEPTRWRSHTLTVPGFHTCDGCGRRTAGSRDLCPDCTPASRTEKKVKDDLCPACNTRKAEGEPNCVECGTPV